MLAERSLPGIVVLMADGQLHAVLPASQVVRFIVPSYVQDHPARWPWLGRGVDCRPGCGEVARQDGSAMGFAATPANRCPPPTQMTRYRSGRDDREASQSPNSRDEAGQAARRDHRVAARSDGTELLVLFHQTGMVRRPPVCQAPRGHHRQPAVLEQAADQPDLRVSMRGWRTVRLNVKPMKLAPAILNWHRHRQARADASRRFAVDCLTHKGLGVVHQKLLDGDGTMVGVKITIALAPEAQTEG